MRATPLLVATACLTCSAVAEAEPGTRLALRISPPFAAIAVTNHGGRNLGLGGLAVGLTLPNRLWLEASANALLGLDVPLGYDANLLAGYALGDDPHPHAWDFSVPLFVGYRHVVRPPSRPTDGHGVWERMEMGTAGARAVWTHTYATNAVELGVGASLSAPFERAKDDDYYADGVTRLWLDVGVTLGVLFGL